MGNQRQDITSLGGPMNLKRIVSCLLIATTLTTAMPKKAEAGFVIGGSGVTMVIAGDKPALYGTGAGMAAVGMLTFITGTAMIIMGTPLLPVGVALFVLSEDGSLPQSDLEKIIAMKYPFIQEADVIQDLAILIKEKAEAQEYVNDQKFVTVSEEEVHALLAHTDLPETSPEQVQILVNELK